MPGPSASSVLRVLCICLLGGALLACSSGVKLDATPAADRPVARNGAAGGTGPRATPVRPEAPRGEVLATAPSPLPPDPSSPAVSRPIRADRDEEPPARAFRAARRPRPVETAVPAADPPAAATAPPPPSASASPLKPAALAWNTPADLQMGQSKQVELRITLDAERMAMLASRIRADGVTTTAHADFAPVVIATLSSTQFDVSPPGPQRQQIMQGRDAVWAWAISPKSVGTHPLILHVESELPEANVKDPFVREIQVRALPVPMVAQAMDFAMRNWDKLLTLVLLPLAAWAFKWWRARRRPEALAQP